MASYENTTIKKMTYNGQKVKKWYHNGVKVFSAGNVVTYYVDTDNIHTEEVDSEASCLSPTTFTPSKTGYTFVGWRNDTSASSDVLATRIMGDEPISLYAVFKRMLTATFDGNSPTSGSVASISAAQYYNNGTTLDPTITLPANGFTKTNYTFTKWDLGDPGITIVLTADTTITAQWMTSVYNYGYTGGMQSFTAPETGTYQLEVWGAQGDSSTSSSAVPGYGGYGAGQVELTKGQIIYIYVGGMPVRWSGGYNGGGHGFNHNGYNGGGGATHMAKTNRGVLSSYYNYKSEVYLVAGGGGGAGYGPDANGGVSGMGLRGGSGGGGSGSAGYGIHYSGYNSGGGEGGTQTGGGKGGHADYPGQFGQGGQSASGTNRAGGGGGWYGGGVGGDPKDDYGGGGGGSGYIGGVTKGSWSNGARSGNGYAKVTLIALASAQKKTSFAFTGDVQEYTAPETGTYTLEVWGAQGGRSVDSYSEGGGRGGYSYGNVTLTKGQVLYIYVGEKGSIDGSYTSNRYNGGGEGDYNGDGGGATHIATTKRGVLSNYASYKSEVLIVAGGGGGASYHAAMGGYGGGSTGGDGTDGDRAQGRGRGGTQTGTAEYYWSNNAGFGQGGNGTLTTNYGFSGGGGGGWYGGTAGLDHEGGGGGSGYIGGVTGGVTMGDQRSGHGAANIYFLG